MDADTIGAEKEWIGGRMERSTGPGHAELEDAEGLRMRREEGVTSRQMTTATTFGADRNPL